MKNIIMIFLLSAVPSTILLCQKKTIDEGLYEGGVCVEQSLCGYWFIKSNKTFVFLNFQGTFLKQVGHGTWSWLKDSTLGFIFAGPQAILDNAMVEYSSETKMPFDSSYITGTLLGPSGKKAAFASVIINKKYQAIADKDGNFKMTLPASITLENMTIVNKANGLKPFELALHKGSNQHRLNIMLPADDSMACYPIYHPDPLMGSALQRPRVELKLKKGTKNKYQSLGFIGSDRKWIIAKLDKAKQQQPALETTIDSLEAMIRK